MIEMAKRLTGRDLLGRHSRSILLPFCRSQGELRPARQQSSPNQVQIRQREDSEGPRRILGQAAVTNFGEAPEPFDHMKGVFTACPTARSRSVDRALIRRQRMVIPGPAIDPIADASMLAVLAVIFRSSTPGRRRARFRLHAADHRAW